MGSITISAASISVPSIQRNNIFTTSANINYSCSAQLTKSQDGSQPSSYSSGTHYWYTYSYSALSYSWAFSPSGSANSNSGSTIVSGLSIGDENIISGTVTVSCTEGTTLHSRTDTYIEDGYWNPEPQPAHGEPGDEDYVAPIKGIWHDTSYWDSTYSTGATNYTTISNSSSSSITVYTRPGIFTSYNFPQNTIIQSSSGLTATKVSNWITHCNNFAHWYNQNNIDTAGANCAVLSNDIITAAWYNACVDACADATTKPAYVTGGPNGTIITTTIFSALGAAISKSDN